MTETTERIGCPPPQKTSWDRSASAPDCSVAGSSIGPGRTHFWHPAAAPLMLRWNCRAANGKRPGPDKQAWLLLIAHRGQGRGSTDSVDPFLPRPSSSCFTALDDCVSGIYLYSQLYCPTQSSSTAQGMASLSAMLEHSFFTIQPLLGPFSTDFVGPHCSKNLSSVCSAFISPCMQPLVLFQRRCSLERVVATRQLSVGFVLGRRSLLAAEGAPSGVYEFHGHTCVVLELSHPPNAAMRPDTRPSPAPHEALKTSPGTGYQPGHAGGLLGSRPTR